MRNHFLKYCKKDGGFSILEVLISVMVGALALAVVAVAIPGALNVFTTTKTNTQTNNDNYNVAAILQKLANDSSAVSQQSSSAPIVLTMNKLPDFLTSEFPNVRKPPYQMNLSYSSQTKQFLLSEGSNTPVVLYTLSNNQNSSNQDSFTLQQVPVGSKSPIFELLPPTALSNVVVPVFFQTDVLPGSNSSANSLTLAFSASTYSAMTNQPVTVYGIAVNGSVPYQNPITITGTGLQSFSTQVTPDSTGEFSYTFNPGTATGSEQLTASAGGATAIATINVSTLTVTISPENQSVPVNGSQVYTVTAASNNQGVSGQSVTVSTSGGIGSFSSTTATTGSNGQATFTFTASGTPGIGTITASVDGVQTQTQVKVSGLTLSFPNNEYNVLTDQAVTITGSAMENGTAYHNPITLTGTGLQSFQIQVTPDASGNFSYTFNPGTATGSEQLTASAGGTTANATINVSAPTVTISPENQSIAVNGSQDFTATVTANNQNVSGQTVTIAASSGIGSFSSSSGTTGSNGQATFTFTASNTAGTGTITATVDGVQAQTQVTVNGPIISFQNSTFNAYPGQPIKISGTVVLNGTAYTGQITITGSGVDNSFTSTVTPDSNGNFSFTYTPGSATGEEQLTAEAGGSTASVKLTVSALNVVVTPEVQEVAIGGSDNISVAVTANNQGVSGQLVTIAASNGLGSFSSTTATTDSNGKATFTFKAASTTTGTMTGTITATVEGGTPGYASVTVQGPTITFAQSSYSMPVSQTLTINGTVMLGGAPYTLGQITLTGQGIGGSFPAKVTPESDGSFSFTYTPPTSAAGDPIPGSEQITAQAAGSTATVSIGVFVPSMTISPQNPDFLVNSSSHSFTVTIKNSNGPLSGQSVTISTDGGGSFSQTTGDTNSSGQISFPFTVGNTPGSYTITATAAGTSIQTNLTVSAADVTVSVNPATVNGGDSTTVSGQVTYEGKGLANQQVTLSDNGANGAFSGTNGTTNSDGSFTTTTKSDGSFTATYSTQISSLRGVQWFGDSTQPTIVINGSGFGDQQGYVWIYDNKWDQHGHQWWDDGSDGKWDKFNVLSWTDSQVIIQPSNNFRYGYAYGYDQHYLFNQGDTMTIVINRTDGDEAHVLQSTVDYQGDQINLPVTITAVSDGGSANATLTVSAATLPSANPTIDSITWEGDKYDPQIFIKGTDFGTPNFGFWGFHWFASINSNGTLVFKDTSNGTSWEMGSPGASVRDNILSWTNTKIIVHPGWGYGHGGDSWFGRLFGTGSYFEPNDSVVVTLTLPGTQQSVSANSIVSYNSDHGDGFWGSGWNWQNGDHSDGGQSHDD